MGEMPSPPAGGSESSIVHFILDHPKLWGVVTLLAIAPTFAPKVSSGAVWFCLVCAEITTVALASSIAKKFDGSRIIWALTTGLLSLILFVWYGLWLTTDKTSANVTSPSQATKQPDTAPKMKAHIFGISVVEMPDNQQTGMALVQVTVTNIGPPSAAINWQVSAKLMDGETVRAEILNRPCWLWSTNRRYHMAVPTSHYLQNKTDPIPTGGTLTGSLCARFNNVTRNNLEIAGIPFTASFEDAEGNRYADTWGLPGEMNGPPPH